MKITIPKSVLTKRIAAILLGASVVSAGGVALIKQHEGVRYHAYPDPASGNDPWTICYGHTKGVVKGMTANQETCDRWLKEDLAAAEAVVQLTVKVPLSQGEYDSYVSFVFNAGQGNWQSSTMLRKLNAGDRVGACNQFPRWIYADKRVFNGLKTRRYHEQQQCLSFGRTVYVPH